MITATILCAKRLLIVASIPSLITACAINDTSKSATTPIPITLNAPVAIVIEGNCKVTGTLEEWLQITATVRQQFQTRLNEAVAKSVSDVRDDTLYLASLRDTVAKIQTPDCGADVQNILITAMNSAVDILQGYYNRTLSGDINAALVDSLKGLSQAETMQSDLITRMKEQYQVENNMTPTPAK